MGTKRKATAAPAASTGGGRPMLHPHEAQIYERTDGRVMRRLTLYLPLELAERVRMKSAQLDVHVSDFVTGLLTEAMRKEKAVAK